MKNNSRFFVTAMTGLFAVFATARAQITVVDFGESSTYVTSSQNLTGGNGSFTTDVISPAAVNYSGPAFWGGVNRGMDTWQLTDNNEGFSSTGDFDNIRGRLGTAEIGVSATYAFMFSASQTFEIDNTDSSFFLKARRVGGQTEAGVTGVRWMLRDIDDNYYVSALNDTSAAQFSETYAQNTGVTGSSLVDLSWFNYTFGTGAVGSGITDTTAFFAGTQFDAAGFNYTAKRVSGAGAIEMQFADFTVVAIPEPSTLALLGIAGLCAGLFARRRR